MIESLTARSYPHQSFQEPPHNVTQWKLHRTWLDNASLAQASWIPLIPGPTLGQLYIDQFVRGLSRKSSNHELHILFTSFVLTLLPMLHTARRWQKPLAPGNYVATIAPHRRSCFITIISSWSLCLLRIILHGQFHQRLRDGRATPSILLTQPNRAQRVLRGVSYASTIHYAQNSTLDTPNRTQFIDRCLSHMAECSSHCTMDAQCSGDDSIIGLAVTQDAQTNYMNSCNHAQGKEILDASRNIRNDLETSGNLRTSLETSGTCENHLQHPRRFEMEDSRIVMKGLEYSRY